MIAASVAIGRVRQIVYDGTVAVHFVSTISVLVVDAFAIDTIGIFAPIATGTTIRNIVQRVCCFTVAIAQTDTIDAGIVFTNFAITAFIVTATTSINVADLNDGCVAISLTIAGYAFALNTGFTIGAAVVAGTAVVD